MIGIIVAMERELQPYFEKMTDKAQTKIRNMDFFTGTIGNKKIVMALSGIGKVNASYATTLMLCNFDVELLISTGVSGGLGRMDVMEVVVANKVVQHDCDTTAFGDPIGFVNTVNKVYFETDKKLSAKFVEVLDAKLGIFACGDQFIAKKAVAHEIVKNFDAIACDMESGAIGQIAYIERVPFVVLRCISDSATENAEVTFNDVVAFASIKLADAVVRVIKSL